MNEPIDSREPDGPDTEPVGDPAPEPGDIPADDPAELGGGVTPSDDPPAPESFVEVGAICRKCTKLVTSKVPERQRTGSMRCDFCGYDSVYFSR